MIDYIVPGLLFIICIAALHKKENAYDVMLSGAAEGLNLVVSLIPTLVLLLTAISMLRASGAVDMLSKWASPAFRFFGIPPETALLVLIRMVPLI